MKARTVNFERGQEPKAAMDIGGINLLDELNKLHEELDNKWMALYKSTLKGKKVYGEFKRQPSKIINGRFEETFWKKQTVHITDDENKIQWDKGGNIGVVDAVRGHTYLLNIREKIWIK